MQSPRRKILRLPSWGMVVAYAELSGDAPSKNGVFDRRIWWRRNPETAYDDGCSPVEAVCPLFIRPGHISPTEEDNRAAILEAYEGAMDVGYDLSAIVSDAECDEISDAIIGAAIRAGGEHRRAAARAKTMELLPGLTLPYTPKGESNND